MRIASSFFYHFAAQELGRQQTGLARIQEQLSTGKKILRPSDDPVGSARALDLGQNINQLEQFNNNAILADQRLKLEDSILDNVTQLVHRVKDLALQANSGAPSAETRRAYFTEVQQRLSELVDIANYQDANGDYLFSGFQGRTQPFVQNAAGVVYNGDQGQQHLQIGTTRQIASSDSGFEVFQRIRNGNGTFNVSSNAANIGTGVIAPGSVVNRNVYQAHSFMIRFTSSTTYDVINTTTATTILPGQSYVSGGTINFNGIQTSVEGVPQSGDEFFVAPSQNQDLFATLQNFINTLQTDPIDAATRAQITQAVNGVIGDLDQSLGHILDVRTSVGARLNALDSSQDENDAVKIELQTSLSHLQDVDYAEAITRMEYQLLTLQATQQSFMQIQGLSLFNFIR